jgi:hypothetical protein
LREIAETRKNKTKAHEITPILVDRVHDRRHSPPDQLIVVGPLDDRLDRVDGVERGLDSVLHLGPVDEGADLWNIEGTVVAREGGVHE